LFSKAFIFDQLKFFKMRKFITFISMMLFFTAKPAFAQIKVGICAGLNLATIAGQGLNGYSVNTRTGFQFGAIVEKAFSQNLSIQSGLSLSSKGAKIAGNNFTSEIAPMYLEIPLNLLYNERFGTSKVHLFAGPYLAIGLGGKNKVNYLNATASNDIKFGTADDSSFTLTDVGVNMGIGVEIQRLLLRFQYGLSLSNLDPKGMDSADIKHRVIGISVGYMFGY
jgi:Outer membrane protein beta-barrel domain